MRRVLPLMRHGGGPQARVLGCSNLRQNGYINLSSGLLTKPNLRLARSRAFNNKARLELRGATMSISNVISGLALLVSIAALVISAVRGRYEERRNLRSQLNEVLKAMASNMI